MGSNSPARHPPRVAVIAVCTLAFVLLSRRAHAQLVEQCSTDRTVSTLVGAGLGLAAGAIPATIVHRHDQTSSHRIVVGSLAVGAVIGYLAAGRDRPCSMRVDSAHVAVDVIASRTTHAKRGALAGAVIVGVAGAVAAGTLYNVGCTSDPCSTNRTGIMLFTAAEGALAGGILGSLIGWTWPVRQ